MTEPADDVQPVDHVVLDALGADLVERLAAASRAHDVMITVSVVPYAREDEEEE